MLLELGPLSIRTGAHRADGVAKADLRAGSVDAPGSAGLQAIARSLARDTNASAPTLVASPAMGFRPDPGPLPPEAEPIKEALRYQFRQNVNSTYSPRSAGAYPAMSFAMLRAFSLNCDIARICIETRKDQLCSLDWDLAVRDGVTPSPEKLNACRTFFQTPDRVRPFKTWLRLAIEEVLVTDALTISRTQRRAGGFRSLDIIDGTTMQVLLDSRGEVPTAPAKAYRQIIYGQPTVGGDYSTNEMYYLPRTVRADTPYGLSPIEAILLALTSLLNRMTFNLQYYAEGNVPAGFMETPALNTVQQIRDYQAYLDGLTGNQPSRQRLMAVMAGTKLQELATPVFATDWDEHLLKIACAAFAVPPSEIGFTNDVNRATGKQQENVVYRRGVKPMAAFFKDIFDRVLANDLQAPEYEFIFTGGEPEDKLTQARTDQIYVQMGKTSIDELRQRDGQEQIGLGCYIQGAGVMLVSDLTGRNLIGDDELLGGVEENEDLEDAPPSLEANAAADTDTTGAPADQGRNPKEAALAELRKWRAVAIATVKGKRPGKDRPFITKAIPAPLAAALAARLPDVQSVADVVKMFDRAAAVVGRARFVTKVRRKNHGKALGTAMSDFFTAQGAAVAAHVTDGLRGRS